MFSDAERNLNQDTLEYAWLFEIQLGKLSGKVTAPQVCLKIFMLTLLSLLLVIITWDLLFKLLFKFR